MYIKLASSQFRKSFTTLETQFNFIPAKVYFWHLWHGPGIYVTAFTVFIDIDNNIVRKYRSISSNMVQFKRIPFN